MTDTEKADNPDYETPGGYLKTNTYHEAWAEFWRDTTQDVRDRFLSLPHFDAAKFLDITGIDVTTKQETIEIEGVKYTLAEVKDALTRTALDDIGGEE